MKLVAVWVTAVLRRLSRMPPSSHAAHAMAGSVHSICTGFKSARDTAFLFVLPLWLYNGTTEHGRPHPSLLQVSRQGVAPILFCRARASTGLELAFTPSLRLPFYGAVRLPPSRRSGARDDCFVSSGFCCRCLPSYSWYLSAFVVAGAEVGGWAPKFFGIMHAVKTSIASGHSGGEAS